MSKEVVDKISENLERVIFRIDAMYDKDLKTYTKLYKRFHNLCERYSLVEGDINAKKNVWLLSKLKLNDLDTLLDIHNDLNAFLIINKELKIKIKL